MFIQSLYAHDVMDLAPDGKKPASPFDDIKDDDDSTEEDSRVALTHEDLARRKKKVIILIFILIFTAISALFMRFIF